MSIQVDEIKWYKPAVINDTNGNGGVMSANECVDEVKNNVWPDVSKEERKTGSVKYRKTFIKVANPDNPAPALLDPQIFVESATPGDDSIVILLGTQTDTQSDVLGYTRFYGAASLDAPANADDTFIKVKVEPGNGAKGHKIFQAGDVVRISDMENVNADGNVEFVRLEKVTWNGLLARLHLTEGSQLKHSYHFGKVSSVIEAPEIRATVEKITQHTKEGEFTCEICVNNIGAVEQIWTISFTSSTEFCCYGNTLGLVGTGVIDHVFAPNNPDFNMPYFCIGRDGWGGPFWDIGESVTFTTHPASVAVWEKRTVPAGCKQYAGNKVVVAITGNAE